MASSKVSRGIIFLNGMSKVFKRGDHVAWNSEAGRVRGVIIKKFVSDYSFKGYVHQLPKKNRNI